MPKFLSVFTIILALSGCALFQDETDKVQAGCVAVTAGVEALTPHKSKLTSSQVDTVNEVLDAVHPICGMGAEPIVDDVNRAILENSKARIEDLLEKVRQ